MYRDPEFPQEYVTHDTSDKKELQVPTNYEVMRRNYQGIQRSNPSYLAMSVKSYTTSHKSIQYEVNNRQRTTTEETDLPLFSYEIDNTSLRYETDESNPNSPIERDPKNSPSALFKFLSDDKRMITV